MHLHFGSYLNIEMVQVTEILSLQMTRNNLSSTFNNMAEDDLATQGARASSAKVLTSLSWKIPNSAPEWLMQGFPNLPHDGQASSRATYCSTSLFMQDFEKWVCDTHVPGLFPSGIHAYYPVMIMSITTWSIAGWGMEGQLSGTLFWYHSDVRQASRHSKSALEIMMSHQQNTQVFADGRNNMNDVFDNYVCSASHMRPGLHFQNV